MARRTRLPTPAVVALAVVIACRFGSADMSAKEPNLKQDMINALGEQLKTATASDPKDYGLCISLAKALIRMAPENQEAAKTLIDALGRDGGKVQPPVPPGPEVTVAKAAYDAIAETIRDAPPALITAILPLLKDAKLARQAAELLSKVDRKALEDPSYAYVPYNRVRQRSSHNSYSRDVLSGDKYEDIFDQVAYWRIRSLELDLHNTKELVPLPGDWFIYHEAIPGFMATSVQTLGVALDLMLGVNRAVPEHEVITIWLELKDNFDNAHTPDLLDKLLRDKLGPDRLFTPAQLIGNAKSLQDSVKGGWPTLTSLRGKFIFVMHGETERLDAYVDKGKSARSRVGFIAPEISKASEIAARDYAVFFNSKLENAGEVGPAVHSRGFVSRTYRIDDESDWKKAVNAKVHHIATDVINSVRDPWSRTHNEKGWPFQEIEPTSGIVYEERGPAFTLSAQSDDMTGKRDSCYYVYSDLPDDGRNVDLAFYIAVPSSHVDSWAKGLVMARASLEADSPYLAVLKPADNNGPRVQLRRTRGANTGEKEAEIEKPVLLDKETPMLVRLRVSNNNKTVTAWGSYVGGPNDWKLIHEETFRNDKMRYLGLAVSSRDPRVDAKFFFGHVQGRAAFTRQTKIGGSEVTNARWERGIRP